jgi:hypothetical protein
MTASGFADAEADGPTGGATDSGSTDQRPQHFLDRVRHRVRNAATMDCSQASQLAFRVGPATARYRHRRQPVSAGAGFSRKPLISEPASVCRGYDPAIAMLEEP